MTIYDAINGLITINSDLNKTTRKHERDLFINEFGPDWVSAIVPALSLTVMNQGRHILELQELCNSLVKEVSRLKNPQRSYGKRKYYLPLVRDESDPVP
jgi:hypothetical protein